MLAPEYLSNVPDRMSEIYAKVEEDIIAYMAERIAAADYANASVLNQVERLEEMGVVRSEIWRRLADALDKTEGELKHIMLEAGILTLASEDEVYRRAGKDPAPLRASESLQTVLETGYERTFGEFKNITATTANTATGQFERFLDQAYTEVASGIFSSQEAVKKAIERLSKQGIQSIVYPSGHTDSLDVAIRRAVRTGVNQACGDLQMKRAEEMESDLVQVTAHQGARPDHAVWQGKIFSISGTHKKYPKLADATGYGTGAGLKGWNCKHDFSAYIEGTKPLYNERELKRLQNEKVTYNGKEIPLYEATQIQRKNERMIRRWKREAAALKAAGQPNSKALAKVRQWTEAQDDFLEQTGLKRRYDLEKVVENTMAKQLPETKAVSGFRIGRSVGAKSKNYRIIDKETGMIYHFLEGSRIQNAEVFAGKGVKSPLRQEVKEGLSAEYKEHDVKPEEWQHLKGIGELVGDEEEIRKAEVHWFQAPKVGKVKFKVKRWLDEG